MIKNETSSFKIDSHTLEKLKDNSKREDIPVEGLVRMILNEYADMKNNLPVAEFVEVKKMLLYELVENYSKRYSISFEEMYHKYADQNSVLLHAYEYSALKNHQNAKQKKSSE